MNQARSDLNKIVRRFYLSFIVENETKEEGEFPETYTAFYMKKART
jgi:hypothetical protein